MIYFNKSIENQKKITSSEDPSLADTYAIVAKIYFEKGVFDQAMGLYRTTLSIYNNNYPLTHKRINKVKQDIKDTIKRLQV